MYSVSIGIAAPVVVTERSLAKVAPLILVALSRKDLDFLVRADADAQTDINQLFSNVGKPKVAFVWIRPDRSSRLPRCHAVAGSSPYQ